MTMPEPSPIRVALIEDDRRFRDALAVLIEGTPGFSVVATLGSVEEALARRVEPRPEVVLLDHHLPGQTGAEGVGRLVERWPDAAVLMLTVFEEEEGIFQSLCNGAVGYLLKRTPPGRLLDAVREARGGGAPMSPEIARKVIRAFQRRGAPPAEVEAELTAQETKLLALLAEGESYQTAGDRLFISINTVRKHIRSIYEKLQVHTKSEAVGKAMRAGLI